MQPSKRLYQIDFLRFFAAISVVLFHYTFRGFMADNWSPLEFEFLGSIFKYGFYGVHLFFIISGFVISLSIQDNSFVNFLISRITRLYPAYWFCVTLTFIAIMIWGAPIFEASLNQYLVNLTMMQKFFNISDIDGVYWTLAIELKFYFIIGLYLLINYKNKIKLDVFIFSWLALTIIMQGLNSRNIPAVTVVQSFFDVGYNSYFIAGMLLYRIYKAGNKITYIGALLLCLVISLRNLKPEIGMLENVYKSPISYYIAISIVVFWYLVIYLCSINYLQSLNKKSFMWLGALTYPLYLIHENIGFMMFNKVASVNKYILLSLVIAIMLMASYIINRYVEIPMSSFMKKYLKALQQSFKKDSGNAHVS
jgi:peptidoglycan/LPS O-acetylase OafA/YrhL